MLAKLMERDQAIQKLRQHEAELKRLGVKHLYLFGSTTRGDAHANSDINLFFNYERGVFGLFQLMDVKERDSLHKTLRQRIEAAAVPIFNVDTLERPTPNRHH